MCFLFVNAQIIFGINADIKPSSAHTPCCGVTGNFTSYIRVSFLKERHIIH